MSDNVQRWLEFFEKVGGIYRELYLVPLWKEKYSKHSEDMWESLHVFLEAYAFERQGRKPDYFFAAVDALSCMREQGLQPNDSAAPLLWRKFIELLRNQGLIEKKDKGANKNNNPLYYNKKDGKSLLEVITKNQITVPFTVYLSEMIHQKGISQTINLLKSIRGVGEKIAPYFLRDLSDVLEINIDQKERYKLQPIDIWVERTARFISVKRFRGKEDIAKWLTETSLNYNLKPERVNMGIWVFASSIVKSQYRLAGVLKDFKKAEALLSASVNGMKNACKQYDVSLES